MGHSVGWDGEKICRSERKEVDRFMHLFNSQTVEQRAAIMYRMFASSPFDDCDIQMLRKWLKEVAKIMNWKDQGQVCELLGVVLLDAEAEARLKEQEAEANALIDGLDEYMCNSATINGGPPQSPHRQSRAPSGSDVWRVHQITEQSHDMPT